MSETTGTRRSRPGFLRAVTRRFGTWPLFGVILVWVVLALVVFTVLGWLWGDCGVIKKIKGCVLAFYLLFLARDRFRSFFCVGCTYTVVMIKLSW